MGFLGRLFGSREPLPAPVPWMALPSLSAAVFGSVERTPDLHHVRRAFRDAAAEQFAADPSAGGEALAYCERLAEEKFGIHEIPAVSESGFVDRLSRLGQTLHALHMVVLLLEEGAEITPENAAMVPVVLREFTQPLCALVQGRGHHLFVRVTSIGCHRDGLWAGVVSDGYVAKRVKYLTLDARSNGRYEI